MTVAPAPGSRFDRESIHQPPGPDDSNPQPGRRDVLSVENGLEIVDAHPPLADPDQQGRGGRRLDEKLDSTPAGILNGVAGDLGRGGGDAGLIELGESQERGDLTRPLPGQHDVGFKAEIQAQERHVHGRSPSVAVPPKPSRRPVSLLWSR